MVTPGKRQLIILSDDLHRLGEREIDIRLRRGKAGQYGLTVVPRHPLFEAILEAVSERFIVRK